MAALVERLGRSERRPAHRLYASQLARLRAPLVHALTHSPLHRERLGLSPDAAARIDWPGWRRLPTLARATLQRHLDRIVVPALPADHGLPVLSRIAGRRRNMLVFPDGSRHWPSFPASVWLPSPAIRRVQRVQTAFDMVELRMHSERDLAAVERERLGWPHGLRVCRVDSLRVAGSHKLEDFLSLVEPQA